MKLVFEGESLDDIANQMQLALQDIARPAVQVAHVAPSAELPGPATAAAPPACPIHHKSMNFRPAGVSQRTGKAYSAFYSCPERDCNQKADA